MLNKEGLIAATERRFMEVDIPGGETVRIRSINTHERGQRDGYFLDKNGDFVAARARDTRAVTFAMCVVDADGNQMFELSDLKLIRAMDSIITDAVFNAAIVHCGMQSQVGEAAENFDEAQD